jgi:hypothetical protein
MFPDNNRKIPNNRKEMEGPDEIGRMEGPDGNKRWKIPKECRTPRR